MPYCNTCRSAFRGQGIYCHLHNQSAQSQSLIQQSQPNQSVNTWNPSTVAQTLRDPSLQYYFNSVAIDTRSETVTATMNNQREQCQWCDRWFADKEMLSRHYPSSWSGCYTHKLCFSRGDNVVHAMRSAHQRCFVSNCSSNYHTLEGWSNDEIVAHVRKDHKH